jgi:hypothetical protein
MLATDFINKFIDHNVGTLKYLLYYKINGLYKYNNTHMDIYKSK